jgi:tryptophan-rich sensory protein
MKKKSVHSFVTLTACIAICEAIGIIGSLFTIPAIQTQWYQDLLKPAFQPPAWLFAPVWTILYACMGIATYLIWIEPKTKGRLKAQAMTIFTLQLIMNLYWSILFFGKQNPGLAFIEILILWISILCTILVFHRISKIATYLLIPYLFWVSFASVLNFSLWLNNRNISVVPIIKPSIACTMEAKICPDGSAVGRRGPNCEFDSCPASPMLPEGYSISQYTIATTTDIFCVIDADCTTPMEYAIRSNCPYTSLCVEDRCAVVCPDDEN